MIYFSFIHFTLFETAIFLSVQSGLKNKYPTFFLFDFSQNDIFIVFEHSSKMRLHNKPEKPFGYPKDIRKLFRILERTLSDLRGRV